MQEKEDPVCVVQTDGLPASTKCLSPGSEQYYQIVVSLTPSFLLKDAREAYPVQRRSYLPQEQIKKFGLDQRDWHDAEES